MEYRLKKDLPFAKVGSEVYKTRNVRVKGIWDWMVTTDRGMNEWIGNTTMDMSDWIEEVKFEWLEDKVDLIKDLVGELDRLKQRIVKLEENAKT